MSTRSGSSIDDDATLQDVAAAAVTATAGTAAAVTATAGTPEAASMLSSTAGSHGSTATATATAADGHEGAKQGWFASLKHAVAGILGGGASREQEGHSSQQGPADSMSADSWEQQWQEAEVCCHTVHCVLRLG